jgi:hypothetical protein
MQGSICATRKYDAFLDSAHKEGTPKALDYYALSKIFPADAKLSELVLLSGPFCLCVIYACVNSSSEWRLVRPLRQHDENAY